MVAERLLPGLAGKVGAVRRLAPGRPHRRGPSRLDQPVDLRRPLLRANYDPDSFGRASERIARFLGTGRFLVYMTAVVVVWVALNVLGPLPVRFDRYPFTFLTLVLSLQASYAAPLILLAQNRQDDRDRVNQDTDRRADAQTGADLDFVAREVASLRVAVGEVATRDYVRSEIRSLVEGLSELLEQGEDGAEPGRRPKKGAGGGKVKDRGRLRRAGDVRAADGAEPARPDGAPITAPAPASRTPADDETGGTAT